MRRTGAGDPKKTLELLWRDWYEKPSRPGPKPKFTVDDILDTAVRQADEHGIEALSMRAIAAELGVGPMSLYRHVPSKAELIDLMVEHVATPLDEYPDTNTLGWRETLETLGRGMLEQAQRHPWLLDLVQRRPVFGPRSLAGFDFALSAFADCDLPEAEINMIIVAVIDLATGTAGSYRWADPVGDREAQTTEEEWWEVNEPYLTMAWESGRFEHVGRLEDDSAWSTTAEPALEYALKALLDGLAPRIEGARRPG
ncbi:TetR/AcrR family transcriptional regulator [Salininema proteolyticum]|uniref:TetR/AcrR family transcriptional regulator n=1 Tax=Salininema proteolyticum TaxID=1607685 RepID=A0ABV8TY75_9ACTN